VADLFRRDLGWHKVASHSRGYPHREVIIVGNGEFADPIRVRTPSEKEIRVIQYFFVPVLTYPKEFMAAGWLLAGF
jgi:hypothetical protein